MRLTEMVKSTLIPRARRALQHEREQAVDPRRLDLRMAPYHIESTTLQIPVQSRRRPPEVSDVA